MNGRCRGLVYLLRNLGTREKPQWTAPHLLRIENGEPIETMGNPHPMLEDFDGDGDLDFILSDFPGSYTYFENIGTRKEPVYTSGRLLHDSKGRVLAADECVPVPQAIDWIVTARSTSSPLKRTAVSASSQHRPVGRDARF